MTRKMILNNMILETKWNKDIKYNLQRKKYNGYIVTYCDTCKKQRHHNLITKTNNFCIFECTFCKYGEN